MDPVKDEAGRRRHDLICVLADALYQRLVARVVAVESTSLHGRTERNSLLPRRRSPRQEAEQP
jgi:hypothetical protein